MVLKICHWKRQKLLEVAPISYLTESRELHFFSFLKGKKSCAEFSEDEHN